LIKDISRFKNRDMSRVVLLDPNPVNFMMAPENSFPISEYNAEYHTSDKDPYLKSVIDQLEEIKDLEDVRPALKSKYNVR
jgi:TFIIF-interacting CTD phosphatase-like protein